MKKAKLKKAKLKYDDEIYDLARGMITNLKRGKFIEAYSSEFVAEIDKIMGNGFYAKVWCCDDDLVADEVTQEEVDRLRLLTGPHGETLLQVMVIRGQAR